MDEAQVIILPGKDLSKNDIETINKARLEKFGSTAIINPQSDNEDWTKIYFLAKNENRLVAFGRLHDVKVIFKNEIYDIFGIATVASIEKGKGYGKMLMTAMQNYIQKKGKTGLGFCNKAITPFYEKCNLGVIVKGQKRFYHPTSPRFHNSDVIYVAGKDNLIEKMLQHPSEIAKISRPHW